MVGRRSLERCRRQYTMSSQLSPACDDPPKLYASLTPSQLSQTTPTHPPENHHAQPSRIITVNAPPRDPTFRHINPLVTLRAIVFAFKQHDFSPPLCYFVSVDSRILSICNCRCIQNLGICGSTGSDKLSPLPRGSWRELRNCRNTTPPNLPLARGGTYGLHAMKTDRTSRLPSFFTQVIGSLPRPQAVRDLLAQRDKLPADRFRQTLDDYVVFAIRLQEQVGLDVISDGEWRRTHYVGEFLSRVGGIEKCRKYNHQGETKVTDCRRPANGSWQTSVFR